MTRAEISVYFIKLLVLRLALKSGLVEISSKKSLVPSMVKLNPLIPKKKLLLVAVKNPLSLMTCRTRNPSTSVMVS